MMMISSFVFLRGLGSEFNPIVVAINARDTFPPLESVIGKHRNFELRISAADATSSTISLYTNRHHPSSSSKGACGGRGCNNPTQINLNEDQRVMTVTLLLSSKFSAT